MKRYKKIVKYEEGNWETFFLLLLNSGTSCLGTVLFIVSLTTVYLVPHIYILLFLSLLIAFFFPLTFFVILLSGRKVYLEEVK